MNWNEEKKTMQVLGGTFGSLVLLIVGLVTLMFTWPSFFEYWEPVALPVTLVAVGIGFGIDILRARRRAR